MRVDRGTWPSSVTPHGVANAAGLLVSAKSRVVARQGDSLLSPVTMDSTMLCLQTRCCSSVFALAMFRVISMQPHEHSLYLQRLF